MKFLRFLLRFSLSIVIALTLICAGLYLTGNAHLIKAVRSTYLVGNTGPTINDYTKFDNRVVQTGKSTPWEKSPDFNSYALEGALLEDIERWETSALVVIKNDQLLFESYWDGSSSTSKTNTFSMAKSFTSLCIGAAIMEGKIRSVDQKVGDFLPEFSKGKKSEITIRHLLNMNSGIDFGESYGDPFGFMAKTYYGTEIYDISVSKEMNSTAGTVWKYQGGNTLLLSFILKKATGETLSDYFSSHFWKPIGASTDALWSIDQSDEGLEKSYCCFYSNAQDFARIGLLMLDSGKWNGKALIDESYFLASISPVNVNNKAGRFIDYYGYQWWLGEYEETSFYYARGILGQYIVSIPEWDMVLVRLGHKRDPTRGIKIPSDLFTYMKLAKKLAL